MNYDIFWLDNDTSYAVMHNYKMRLNVAQRLFDMAMHRRTFDAQGFAATFSLYKELNSRAEALPHDSYERILDALENDPAARKEMKRSALNALKKKDEEDTHNLIWLGYYSENYTKVFDFKNGKSVKVTMLSHRDQNLLVSLVDKILN